ncbi:helix-turn-helix domain-containing protein [bacterium]|nr:helix-turn-helix domain-containing protein [bacterium]
MRELGEYLKQMRESREVSLEEVANATNVNIRYIQALEDGQYDILPPEVYVQGFLRAYGEFLGIDPDELFARYETDKPKRKSRFFGQKSTSTTTNLPFAKTIGETSQKPAIKIDFTNLWQSIKAVPGILYGFIALIIIIGFVLIISMNGGEEIPATVTEAVLGDTTLQKAASAPRDEDISQAIIIPIDSVNAAQALSVAESLTFDIKTREKIHIYVELDHAKKAFQGFLNRRQKKVWRVKNSIYLEVSNPSALRISVNGFEIKPFTIRYQQVIEINRQNILQLLSEGYVPPATGVSSAYGQRIENANVDTVKGPPSETPKKTHRKSHKKQASANADTGSQKSTKPKIKPPKNLQDEQKPQIPGEGME